MEQPIENGTKPVWLAHAKKRRWLNWLNDLTITLLVLFLFPIILLISALISTISDRIPKDLSVFISVDWKVMLLDFGVLVLFFKFQLKQKKMSRLGEFCTKKFKEVQSFYHENKPLATFSYFFFPLLFITSKVRRQEILLFFRFSLFASLITFPLNLIDLYDVYQMQDFWVSRFLVGILFALVVHFFINIPIFLLFFLPLNATFMRYHFEGRIRATQRLLRLILGSICFWGILGFHFNLL